MQSVTLEAETLEAVLRKHVMRLIDWAMMPGTDFWLVANASTGPLASAQGEILSEHGWTTTSLAGAAGSGADFLTNSDRGTPGEYTQGSQNDLLESPVIFGDWRHARVAAELMHMNTLPNYLVVDCIARFSVVANNEPTTALGLTEDAGGIGVAATHIAALTSNNTTWGLSANGSEGTAFGTADTSPHFFRILLDRAAGKAYPGIDGGMYDGVQNSTDGSVSLTADEFPAAFGAGSAGANNRVQLSMAHIWYAWRRPAFKDF